MTPAARTPHDRTIALVTGATRGIGRAIGEALAGAGTTVLIGARDPRRGAEVAAALRVTGGDAHPVHLDVTDPATAAAAASWIDDRFGRLDVLVNNAGISGGLVGQSPGAADPDLVRAVFATNVFGALTVTEAVLGLLRRSGHGRIVNVSSGIGSLSLMNDPAGGFAGLPASLAYAPSKSALNQLTVQYAKALRPDGILVNAADPGPTATDFTADFPGLTRTAADGAAIAVHLATLPDDGPTGAYLADTGPVPW